MGHVGLWRLKIKLGRLCFVGYATETLFSVICGEWKEWRPGVETNLKYEYRIQQMGQKRSFLFYYGHDSKVLI